jgi:hypothetical protein
MSVSKPFTFSFGKDSFMLSSMSVSLENHSFGWAASALNLDSVHLCLGPTYMNTIVMGSVYFTQTVQRWMVGSRIVKNREERGTIHVFAWRDWGNSLRTSVRTAGILDEIRTQHLLTISLDCYRYTNTLAETSRHNMRDRKKLFLEQWLNNFLWPLSPSMATSWGCQ